ncbi:translation initiation factor IF-2-like [Ursus arctos]|uniref:translation initiation factor IF-2-like n=1 Tax=Ursus arctos TaxID=9644 RepID=UPI002547D367|nr:translation initiation factor IF-2-like [Ursus arctos]
MKASNEPTLCHSVHPPAFRWKPIPAAGIQLVVKHLETWWPGKPRVEVRPPGAPARVLGSGAAGRGPKVSSAASRALIGFRGRGPAVGPKGAARGAGGQLAARRRAHGKHRGGAARHRSQPGPGPDSGQAAPPAGSPGAGRAARGGGGDRAFCRHSAAAPERPHPGLPEAPGRPRGRRRAASARKKPASRAPPRSEPYLRAERRGDERAAEGRGPGRRYLRRPGGAANRKLESARGAAAALSPRRPEARPPQPGVSLQPGSSELASAATRRARERLPRCSDLPEPPPSPGRFPRNVPEAAAAPVFPVLMTDSTTSHSRPYWGAILDSLLFISHVKCVTKGGNGTSHYSTVFLSSLSVNRANGSLLFICYPTIHKPSGKAI